MVGVVVLFAEEHESTSRQPLDQRGGIDEASRLDVPNLPDERMISAEARLPRFPGGAGLPHPDEPGAEHKHSGGITQSRGRLPRRRSARHLSRGIG
jgi:hypothetical protein